MSVDLTRDPMDLFAEKISEANPNLAGINNTDITIANLTQYNASVWPSAAQGDIVSSVVGNARKIAPTMPWYSPEGVFAVGRTITVAEGGAIFTIDGEDTTTLYVNGILRQRNDHTVDGVTTIELADISGTCDIVILCKNTNGYGWVACSVYGSGGAKLTATNTTWSAVVAGSTSYYDWFEVESTVYEDWAGSVLYNTHPWHRDDITGDFVYNGRSSEYTMFGIKRVITSPTAEITLKYVTDNGGYYQIDGGEFVRLVHGETTTHTVTPNVPFILCIEVHNIGGPTGLQLDVIDADGNVIAATDTSWPYQVVGTYVDNDFIYNEESKQYVSGEVDPNNYVKDTSILTTVAVDLVGGESEVFEDYVTFKYNRVPLRSLFLEIDEQIDSKHSGNWPTAAVSQYDGGTQALLTGATLISPDIVWDAENEGYVCKRVLMFEDTTFRIEIHVDDWAEVYIDSVFVGRTTTTDTIETFTASIIPGEHTVAIVVGNETGEGYVEYIIHDDELQLDVSDATWRCLPVSPGDDMVDLAGVYIPDEINLSYVADDEVMLTDDTPARNVLLRDHLLTKYGINVGIDGITRTAYGNSVYRVDISNVLYIGYLIMSPE